MDLNEYIINDLKPFEEDKPIKDLQKVFNQLTYSHAPISNKGEFKGSISENDVHCFQSDKKISDFRYAIETFFVREKTNWLDILEAFAQNNANIMPVLDSENQYLGYYELGDIMGIFHNTPFLKESGVIIIVEKGINDYSFSEISQCVETNNNKLYGVFLSSIEKDVIQAVVKVGLTNINDVVQTFRRYGYVIVSQHEQDRLLESLKDRSNYFNKYLNI